MVRATAAGVLILDGGTYVTGSDATIVGNLLAPADEHIDAYTHPSTLSYTSTIMIHIGNLVVQNLVTQYLWRHDGGQLSGKPEPVILTPQITLLLDMVGTDTTYDGVAYGEMIDDS